MPIMYNLGYFSMTRKRHTVIIIKHKSIAVRTPTEDLKSHRSWAGSRCSESRHPGHSEPQKQVSVPQRQKTEHNEATQQTLDAEAVASCTAHDENFPTGDEILHFHCLKRRSEAEQSRDLLQTRAANVTS